MTDLPTILSGLSGFVRRFVSFTESQATVIAVWIIHTHAFDAAETTPYLAITSAEKRSGKSRLLEVLELLVAKPWMTGRVTAACLVRKTHQKGPTLLLDESDAAFQGEKDYAEALRGILNNGHRRGGVASCCVGQGSNQTYQDFRVFSPKAIAGIGRLPDTVADRAIPIRLVRKLAGQSVQRFRRRDAEKEAIALRIEVAEWAEQYREVLRAARPDVPAELNDRQQDGAEPLLAIADLAGSSWPARIRQAIVEICTSEVAEDDSHRVQLLRDIRGIFDSRGMDKLSSRALLENLTAIETSPWSEWSHGKPLTARGLSNLLRPFGIAPKTVRTGGETFKGYEQESFRDSWERYCPAVSLETGFYPSQPSQCSKDAGETLIFDPSHEGSVTDEKSEESPINTRGVTHVTDTNPLQGPGVTKAVEKANGKAEANKGDSGLVCPGCGQRGNWATSIGLAKHQGTECKGEQMQ